MAKKGGNPQNLVNFKKGEDPRRKGNGRKPKLPNLDIILAEVLGEVGAITKEEAAITILKALRRKAAAGDVRAAEVLLDRAYGKAKQIAELTTVGNSSEPQTIIIYNNVPPMIKKEG